jgi:hypothetical protein
MKTLLLFFLVSISTNISAQTFAYKYVSQIDSIIKYSSDEDRYQLAATYYSFIGEYKAMLKTIDQEFDDSIYNPTQEQKNLLAKYRPINAKEYILQQAKKTRIIIFNEAHWQPMHRVFVSLLLPMLKKIGYNFIGIETLSYDDSLLARRKYPIINTGYYTNEPCFGNFVRTALNLSMTLFPYDVYDNMEQREIKEAENIKAIIDKNPNAKFIIYCGFDHCIEDSSHTRMIIPMAGRVKQMTGIDPLTIDQVELNEKSVSVFENKYRQLINLNYDAVLVDSSFNAFNKANPRKFFDCNLYHPKTTYINGRPNWLITSDRTFVDIKSEITIDFPCLVKVYEANDNIDNAVPIDIIELENKIDNKQIIVNKTSKYRVVITNLKGQRQILEGNINYKTASKN